MRCSLPVNDNAPREETYRATLRVRTPDGDRTTLIVTRQGLGAAGRVWLTFQGAIRTTAVLTDEEARQLAIQIESASSARLQRDAEQGVGGGAHQGG
jgi:hypothetical protein